jgi:hypothetical protein
MPAFGCVDKPRLNIRLVQWIVPNVGSMFFSIPGAGLTSISGDIRHPLTRRMHLPGIEGVRASKFRPPEVSDASRMICDEIC